MKVYVTGDSSKHVVALANVLNYTNNVAIMSEVKSSDYEDLVEDVSESINKDFDIAAMVSENPIEASVKANKTGNLRAAVVRTVAEARYARRAGVNLLIFDAAGFNRNDALNIITGWLSTASAPRGEPAVPRPERRRASIRESGASVLASFMPDDAELRKPAKRQMPAPRVREEMPSGPAPKGLLKKIKYTFGLIE
ncbi:MAG: RpiB/LacA/LacB family sugar-phosphate isomerase [Candidatus Micrarchaeota archaeon]|nr:RpiB/LacA/LacB family sugar-phosphate isomerase [Candidatus Micrarchaeota archaeon]